CAHFLLALIPRSPILSSSPSFFFNPPSTSYIYTLSLHDALPISTYEQWQNTFRVNVDGSFLICKYFGPDMVASGWGRIVNMSGRSEEHTSELQSRFDLVCRLLLEKKKKN